MSRRSRAVRRETPPDPKFESRGVTKFINNLMVDGKKSKAEKIFYDAVDIMEQRSGQPGLQVFETAVNNAKPALEVKSRRVGGATYQVPIEVRPDRRTALATRWLIGFARGRFARSGSLTWLASPSRRLRRRRWFLRTGPPPPPSPPRAAAPPRAPRASAARGSWRAMPGRFPRG